MNTIIVDGNRTNLYDAILWADQQFGRSSYDAVSSFPGWAWRFKFKRSEDASLFALRWS
jgi:hypothetical protein